jgi:hypothetical protein
MDRRENERFFVGVDLGQSSDPTAIAIVRRIQSGLSWREDKQSIFQVGHLERVALHTSYPAIVRHAQDLMDRRPIAGNVDLAIDQTGVGAPVADLFRQANVDFTGVVITGGQDENTFNNVTRVPKLKLVSHLQALLHEGRLHIQKNLPEAPVLVAELQNFRVRYSDSGHMTFNAREGKHDDLVLALAIAVWRAMRTTPADNWIEYYRRLAAVSAPNNEPFGFKISPPFADAKERVRVPDGISTLYLIDGTAVNVPEGRVVQVSKQDAAAFGQRGWERLAVS